MYGRLFISSFGANYRIGTFYISTSCTSMFVRCLSVKEGLSMSTCRVKELMSVLWLVAIVSLFSFVRNILILSGVYAGCQSHVALTQQHVYLRLFALGGIVTVSCYMIRVACNWEALVFWVWVAASSFLHTVLHFLRPFIAQETFILIRTCLAGVSLVLICGIVWWKKLLPTKLRRL